MIKFPSIEQFRHVISDVNRYYPDPETRPIVKFHGTTKLHGTNAGVGWTRARGIWAQSRNHIIDEKSDNCGFVTYVNTNTSYFTRLVESLGQDHICIFGEWCGQGIQNGVAITQLSKRFIIFGVKVILESQGTGVEAAESDQALWLDMELVRRIVTDTNGSRHNVWTVHDFQTWEIDIDFRHPETAQARLEEITTSVEGRCPVSAHFGALGTGEGVVWTGVMDVGDQPRVFRFKVKGDKHKVSDTKSKAPVSAEIVASVTEFTVYAVTEARLQQALIELGLSASALTAIDTGKLIGWMIKDINKEESDVLASNGLTMADVKAAIGARVRAMLIEV